MTFVLGKASLANLEGVHPDLVRAVKRAIMFTRVDFKVIEGVRTDAQAFINFGKGRSAEACVAAGCPAKYAQPSVRKVTWVKNPLSTKHRKQRDGFGHAVDLLPAPYDWAMDDKTGEPFASVARAMLDAAEELGVHVRWGADWDEDGQPREKGETDSPHFEI